VFDHQDFNEIRHNQALRLRGDLDGQLLPFTLRG